jgi:hypothetical protein
MINTTVTAQPAASHLNPSLHQLAVLLNLIIGQHPADLSLSEVHAAADDRHLLALLATRYRHLADFYYLIRKPSTLEQTEAALTHAANILKWGESRRIGGSHSGLCLALAIVLEALQQQFCRRPAETAFQTTWPPATAN